MLVGIGFVMCSVAGFLGGYNFGWRGVVIIALAQVGTLLIML